MDLNSGQPSASSFGTPHPSQSQLSTVSAFSSLASIPGSSSSFNATPSSFQSLSQVTTGAATTTTGSTLVDPNSPELFKQNVQIAMEQVARVNTLARSALNGIQNAYQAGINPAQTQADLTALDQAMDALANVLRQSGIGAYPLVAPEEDGTENAASAPTEQQQISDTTRSVQQLYEVFKRMQESSAVVANLLAAPENLGRPKAQ